MIRAVMVINTQGKHRLAKFYDFQFCAAEQRMSAISLKRIQFLARIPGWCTSTYFTSSLYSTAVKMIFVETLDRCFKNVCELDIVINFNKMLTILDKTVVGGQVMETSSEEVMKAVDEISKLEKSSNAINIVPKSISGRQGR